MNVDQSDELLKEALIISSFVPPGITGRICQKSPPNKTDLPPNGLLSCLPSGVLRTSCIDLSKALKQNLLFIRASSQTMSDVISSSREK